MAFKPNYDQQKRDRVRLKEQKKQEKLQRREEAAALRRAEGDDTATPENGSEDVKDQ